MGITIDASILIKGLLLMQGPWGGGSPSMLAPQWGGLAPMLVPRGGGSPLMMAPWYRDCRQWCPLCRQCWRHGEGDYCQCPHCLCHRTRMKKWRNLFVSTKINFRLNYKKMTYHFLQFNFNFFLSKNEKWEKWILSWFKWHTRWETEESCFAIHFLCLQSKSFVDTSIIFYFWISNCFVIAKE